MTTTSGVRTVFPIVLVPAGEVVPATSPTALDTALDRAITWWSAQLGTTAFDAAPTVIIAGANPRAYYDSPPETQEFLRAELAAHYPELVDEVSDTIIYAVYACLGAATSRAGPPAPRGREQV